MFCLAVMQARIVTLSSDPIVALIQYVFNYLLLAEFVKQDGSQIHYGRVVSCRVVSC